MSEIKRGTIGYISMTPWFLNGAIPFNAMTKKDIALRAIVERVYVSNGEEIVEFAYAKSSDWQGSDWVLAENFFLKKKDCVAYSNKCLTEKIERCRLAIEKNQNMAYEVAAFFER